jgi:16S rRNA C967 or C1407 C5-methylase (RsmB/RsmF family)/NOL1/NOP2/fmu family ribosome biogenesis protein
LYLPSSFITSLKQCKGFDKDAFEAVHTSGAPLTSIRCNPVKKIDTTVHFPGSTPVAWSQYGHYLPARPSFIFDPLLHAGCYYVQEASSMFVEQALLQHALLEAPLNVLDLCAAPGGKSTHLLSLLGKESLLVSNEVIKTRAAILEENITKWGAANSIITNNDPAHFARLPHCFDVIVADAPCSGSGLFRKDPDAVSEWSEANVNLCSQRQQRIIADVWPSLKPGGLFIYATCSYSQAEDEDILKWLSEQFDVSGKRIDIPAEWNIVEVTAGKELYGYRFWPHRLKGEGFFLAVLQKNDDTGYAPPKSKKTVSEAASKYERELLTTLLTTTEGLHLFKQGDTVIGLPETLAPQLSTLQSALYIKKAGIALGKAAGKEWVPEHALALSTHCNPQHPAVALTHEQALQYLRREETGLQLSTKGWLLAQYEGHSLGWMKALGNRINNYYPKQYRILKGG